MQADFCEKEQDINPRNNHIDPVTAMRWAHPTQFHKNCLTWAGIQIHT